MARRSVGTHWVVVDGRPSTHKSSDDYAADLPGFYLGFKLHAAAAKALGMESMLQLLVVASLRASRFARHATIHLPNHPKLSSRYSGRVVIQNPNKQH